MHDKEIEVSPNTYTLFETELGTCGIAWKNSGRPNQTPLVIGFQLPEATARITAERFTKKWMATRTAAIPPRIRDIISRVTLHLRGQTQDFRDIELDLDGSGRFAQQVYEAARAIPAGRTMTYGQLAEAAGHAGAARAVGLALANNPILLIIPCHRFFPCSRGTERQRSGTAATPRPVWWPLWVSGRCASPRPRQCAS